MQLLQYLTQIVEALAAVVSAFLTWKATRRERPKEGEAAKDKLVGEVKTTDRES